MLVQAACVPHPWWRKEAKLDIVFTYFFKASCNTAHGACRWVKTKKYTILLNQTLFLPKWNILNTEWFLVVPNVTVHVTLACDDTLLSIAHTETAQHRSCWCSFNILNRGRLSSSSYHLVQHAHNKMAEKIITNYCSTFQ